MSLFPAILKSMRIPRWIGAIVMVLILASCSPPIDPSGRKRGRTRHSECCLWPTPSPPRWNA